MNQYQKLIGVERSLELLRHLLEKSGKCQIAITSNDDQISIVVNGSALARHTFKKRSVPNAV